MRVAYIIDILQKLVFLMLFASTVIFQVALFNSSMLLNGHIIPCFWPDIQSWQADVATHEFNAQSNQFVNILAYSKCPQSQQQKFIQHLPAYFQADAD